MISKRVKGKRIFYVPGMISLVFIPLFSLFFLYKTNAFKTYGALNVALVPDQEEFEKYKIKDIRDYTTFNFNGEKTQELNLRELRFFVRDLVKRYDTINGAKIHFGPKTDYNTYVNVISILEEEKVPTWAPYKDDIFVVASPKPKKSVKKFRMMSCGYGKANESSWLKLNKEEELRRQLLLYKENWILFLGYSGLVFLNVLVLVKFNNKK